MTKWSELLIKTRVDLDAIDVPEDATADERSCIRDFRFLADGVFSTTERLKAVRERLKRSLARGPKTAAVKAAAKALTAELDEIARDLEFAASRRGQFVLFVNDWAQTFHAQRTAEAGLADITIGTHAEVERIVVAGSVESPRALLRLVELLSDHPPGVAIEYRVTVNNSD
ncbi:MAG: hypothetical protein ABL997_08735 [Planctomycetota bacterium]